MSFTNNPRWQRAGIYSLLQNISTVIFGFGSFYLLVRIFDKDEFGVWALFLTVTTIFESIRVGLIKFGFIKYYSSESNDQHGTIMSASVLLNIFWTFFGIICLILLSSTLSQLWDAPELKQMLYLYCVTAILIIPFNQLEHLQHANYKFKGIFAAHFIRGSLFFIFILAAFLGLFEISLLMLVIVHTLAVFVGTIVYYFYSKPFMTKNFNLYLHKENWTWVRKLFNYGKYVTGTSVSGILYNSIDQFMLGSILSTTSVAVYNTATRISNLVHIPTITIAAMVFPHTAKISNSKDLTAVKNVYERSVGFNLAIIIPLVIIVLLIPELIITIVAGTKYLDAVPLLQIIIAYIVFVPFSRLFGTILDSTGQPHLNFYFTLGGLLVNIILNYFLIIEYGVIGAVFGTMGSSILGFIFMQSLLYKKYNITIRGTLSHILKLYVLIWQSLIQYLQGKK